jgi:hypothetical protein
MTDGEYYRNIYEYIDGLPEEVKTPQPEYEQRISFCRRCGNLVNGLCSLCGCFAEVRAAKRGNHCPDTPAFW